MQEFLPFIVIGITAGSVYGLAGTGLVLTYKTSGVFNFAYGAIAAVAAFVFYWLWQREGLSWQVSALLCLFVLGPLLGLLLELLTRMLSNVGVQYQIVGMIGLALGINGLLTLWASSWSSDTFGTIQIPAFLPTETFTVFDVNVGYDQLITVRGRAGVDRRALRLLPLVAARGRHARRSSTIPNWSTSRGSTRRGCGAGPG